MACCPGLLLCVIVVVRCALLVVCCCWSLSVVDCNCLLVLADIAVIPVSVASYCCLLCAFVLCCWLLCAAVGGGVCRCCMLVFIV